MISKLLFIGEYYLDRYGDTNPLQLNTTLAKADVLLLEFKLENGTCTFEGIQTMEYDKNANQKLLFKNAGGNAVSDFPTLYLDKNIKKSLDKLVRILKNNVIIYEKLTPLLTIVKQQQADIQAKIESHLDSKQNTLLSILVNGEFVGTSSYYEPVIKHAGDSVFQDYYQKYQGTVSRGKDSACFVCGENRQELWGFVNTYNFYSLNEFAYIAGGFKRENGWKNYPVCPDCAKKLLLAREFINKQFDFYFHGNKYFLIPTPVLPTPEAYEIIDVLADEYKALSMRRYEEKTHQQIIEAEEEVFDIAAKQKNIITFTLFFYVKQNAEFKIIQEIYDVYPSRFQTILEAKKQAESFREFKALKGIYKKNEIKDLSFDFGILRTFFPEKFNNDFLDIAGKIINDKPLSKQFILHRISDHLAQKFRNDNMYYDALKAMILMKFLFKLGLIKNKPLKKEVTMANVYEDYFGQHPDFFDADIKKAIFLQGILVEKLLNIQFKERNAKPFRNRLNGLKIDARILKRLLPETISKLEQYRKNYYKDLEQLISVYLVSGEPDLKKMTVDEISFYFVMGMNVAKLFKTQEEPEKGENHE